MQSVSILIIRVIFIVILTLHTEISNVPNYIEVQNALLAVSEIEEVYLISPSQDAQPCKLTEEDVLELSSLLGKVKLKSNGSQDYLNYDGVFPLMFYIIYKDGTQMEFGASNPFYVIDSVGYKSEYAPCDAISSLYWELLPKYDPYFRYLYRYRTE